MASCTETIHLTLFPAHRGTQAQRVKRYEIINDTTSSVIYRLLRMPFDSGSGGEMIHLNLLALCHPMFL